MFGVSIHARICCGGEAEGKELEVLEAPSIEVSSLLARQTKYFPNRCTDLLVRS